MTEEQFDQKIKQSKILLYAGIAVAFLSMAGDILITKTIWEHTPMMMGISIAGFILAVLMDARIRRIRRKRGD